MAPVRHVRTNYLVLIIMATVVGIIALDRIGFAPILRSVTTELYYWALLLGAFAVLLGAANVMWFHLQKVLVGQPGWSQSLALVVTLLVVLISGLISPSGANGPIVEWIFDAIIAPGQATIFALLAFFMAAAAYRYLRIGRSGGVWMVAAALILLVAQMPASQAVWPPMLTTAAAWLLDVPGMATLRGVLLGSSFALILIGIRFLLNVR